MAAPSVEFLRAALGGHEDALPATGLFIFTLLIAAI
jgi:hypothetical protein